MEDSIRVFIENTLDKEPRKMRLNLFLVNFFPIISIVCGIILGHVYKVFSAVIAFSIFFSFILIVILTKKYTVIRTIKSSICLNVFTAINYLLFAMILYSMYNKVQLSLILLSLPLILVATLTILFTLKYIKKEKATSTKSKNGSLAYISGSISIATYIILKKLNVAMDQNVALLLCSALLILLSSVFVILGVFDAIKLYYIKKLHIAFDT